MPNDQGSNIDLDEKVKGKEHEKAAKAKEADKHAHDAAKKDADKAAKDVKATDQHGHTPEPDQGLRARLEAAKNQAADAQRAAAGDPNPPTQQVGPSQAELAERSEVPDGVGPASTGPGPRRLSDIPNVSKRQASLSHAEQARLDQLEAAARGGQALAFLPPNIGRMTLADVERAVHDLRDALRQGDVMHAGRGLLALLAGLFLEGPNGGAAEQLTPEHADRFADTLRSSRDEFALARDRANLEIATGRRAATDAHPVGFDIGDITSIINAVVALLNAIRRRKQAFA